MNGPRLRLMTLGLLAALLAGALLGPMPAGMIVASLLMTLLGNELDRDGHLIAAKIVSFAAWIAVPATHRLDLRDEWLDYVERVGRDGLAPVLAAMGLLLVAAPRLAARERGRPALRAYLAACGKAGEELFEVEHLLRTRGATLTLMVGWFSPGAFWAVPLFGLVRMRSGRLSPVAAVPFGAPLMIYWWTQVIAAVFHGDAFPVVGFCGMLVCIVCCLAISAMCATLRRRIPAAVR